MPTDTTTTERYKDGYLTAKAAIFAGTTIKIIGGLLTSLLLIAAFLPVLGILDVPPNVSIPVGVFLALIVLLLTYAIGTLIAAVGQMLLATLDTAVNTAGGSPSYAGR